MNAILDIELAEGMAILPAKKTKDAANYDLYASETVYLGSGKTEVVSTGLRMRVPVGSVFEIYSRSGLANEGIVVANAPGQIDSDYRGIVGVLLHNQGELSCIIHEGDRIAQGRLCQVVPTQLRECVIAIDETERGEGGFGHTGKR